MDCHSRENGNPGMVAPRVEFGMTGQGQAPIFHGNGAHPGLEYFHLWLYSYETSGRRHERSRRYSFHSGYRTTVLGVSLKVFERFLIISIIFSRLTGNLIAFSGHRRKQLRQSKHEPPNLGSGSSVIAPAGHSLAQTPHREQSCLSSVFGVTGIGALSFFFISAASSGFG